MVMPRYSISYEQTFHILLELLSDPATEGPIEVEQPSEKEATFFRLRYYSFQRTVFAEAERELEHSLKHGDTKGLEEARQKLNKAKRTKRFTVRLKNADGKHFVVFSDRDLKYASINDKLLAMLTQQHTHDPKANAEINSIFANAKQAKDNAFMDLLNRPTADTEALNPTQAFLAETADPKPTLVRSAQWHLEQTILILKHSPKMRTFTREVLGVPDQTWFVQALEATPDLPPHTVLAHPAGIDISHIDVDSSALK